MSDDLMVRGSSFSLSNNGMTVDISLKDMLDGVDALLMQAEKDKDFEPAVHAINSMATAGRVMGISLAKLLHGMNAMWDEDGDLYDYLQSHINIGKTTFTRYIRAWEAVTQAPEEYRDALMVRPMKDLNALGTAVAQGYELGTDDWEQLVEAENNNEFRKVIREQVKGEETSKNGMTLELDEESGDITLWHNNKPTVIGFLNTKLANNNAAVAKAINRIVDNSNMKLI